MGERKKAQTRVRAGAARNGSFWSYRLVRFNDAHLGECFIVCEVRFEDGKPVTRNEGAIVCGSTIEEANGARIMLLDAFKRPPIDESEFACSESEAEQEVARSEAVETFIRALPWSADNGHRFTLDEVKTLVAGNIRNFAASLPNSAVK